VSDDSEQRFLRAREVLRESGFVFDDFINTEMRRILTSDPEDAAGREAAYMRARVATELKQMLVSEVDSYEGTQLIKERRSRPNERYSPL
jgi:hypothetical protein